MAWFNYGNPARRQDRKNVCLRVSQLPEDLVAKAKKLTRFGELIDFVVVSEIRPLGMVMLQFWCRRPGSPRERHTVISLQVPENPHWCCEVDLGRGHVGRERQPTGDSQ